MHEEDGDPHGPHHNDCGEHCEHCGDDMAGSADDPLGRAASLGSRSAHTHDCEAVGCDGPGGGIDGGCAGAGAGGEGHASGAGGGAGGVGGSYRQHAAMQDKKRELEQLIKERSTRIELVHSARDRCRTVSYLLTFYVCCVLCACVRELQVQSRISGPYILIMIIIFTHIQY